jgi:cyclic pyranopterin phosphate synthase
VSLDSLDPQVFAAMSGGRGDPAVVVDGIEAALKNGLTPVKINTVVKRGVNDACVADLVERFRGTGVILRFIEFMDVGTRNHWSREQVVPSAELLERIGSRWPLTPMEESYRGEVATRYRFDDGGGEIGFISSVTDPFCGDCTRARLSANGELYTCLFAGKGADLRGMMREGASDGELEARIEELWGRRSNRYSEQRAGIEHPLRKVEMYQVGG